MRHFERVSDGSIQVKDETGKQVLFKDGKGTERLATPAEFMKMLAMDTLEGYQFSNKPLMQYSFSAYNKAMGANLPTATSVPNGRDLQEMSQSELAKHAFS